MLNFSIKKKCYSKLYFFISTLFFITAIHAQCDSRQTIYLDGENAQIQSNSNITDNGRTLITGSEGNGVIKPFLSSFRRAGQKSIGFLVNGTNSGVNKQRVESHIIRYTNPQNIEDGETLYTGFSTRLDAKVWSTPQNWFLIHQIQQGQNKGQSGNYPYVALELVDNYLSLGVRNGKDGTTTAGNPSGIRKNVVNVYRLQKGIWYDIVVGTKFSPYSANGWASVWIKKSTEDTYQQFIKRNIKVGYYGAPKQAWQNKVGIYRARQQGSNKIYFDEVRMARSFDGAKISGCIDTETSTPQPVSSGQLITNGLYHLKNPQSGQNLLSRSLEQYSARMHNPGRFDDQRWWSKHLGDNFYTFQNKKTGRYLQVSYGQCFNAADVTTDTDSKWNHQRWKVLKNGNTYNLLPAHCMEQALDRSANLPDANVQVYSYWKDSENQKWLITPIADFGGKEGGIQEDLIAVFPNPVNDYFAISGLEVDDNVSVYDLHGKKVLDHVQGGAQSIIHFELFPSGIYIVSILGKKTFKIVKQ